MERVDMWRARHIKSTLDKAPADRKFFRMTIFVPTSSTSQVPCTLPMDVCDIWVTPQIPAPLRANSMLFDYLGAVNGMTPFIESQPGTVYYKTKGKFTSGVVPFTYSNGVVTLYQNVPMIRIDYIPANPSEVSNFTCADAFGQPCDYWDAPYPCPPEILQLIMQSIREVDFRQNPELLEQSIPVNPVNDLSN